jgi:hypothetical protein
VRRRLVAQFDVDHAVGVFIGVRVEQDGADDAEDRNTGADAEREGTDSYDGKAGGPPELPKAVAKILQKDRPQGQASLLAVGVTGAEDGKCAADKSTEHGHEPVHSTPRFQCCYCLARNSPNARHVRVTSLRLLISSHQWLLPGRAYYHGRHAHILGNC